MTVTFGKVTKNSFIQDKFLVPPISVLDGKEGWWLKRRSEWLSLGFKSELGRAKNLIHYSKAAIDACGGRDGTSIFDPVLCELVYRWYCPRNGVILDPFSGGSVRGIVAEILGYNYIGVDLRSEQIEENRRQAAELGVNPKYFVGDSRYFSDIVQDEGDFIFSSPPYFNREHYSDLDEDLNNSKTYEEFINSYYNCIASCCSRLRNNRFAVFEVAESRDKNGFQLSLVSDTIKAFELVGLNLFDDLIHLKPVGSARIRTNMFTKSRKTVPIHENVLVFIKGDLELALAELGEV